MHRPPADSTHATLSSALMATRNALRSLEALHRYANGHAEDLNVQETLLDADVDLTAARRAVRAMVQEYSLAEGADHAPSASAR